MFKCIVVCVCASLLCGCVAVKSLTSIIGGYDSNLNEQQAKIAAIFDDEMLQQLEEATSCCTARLINGEYCIYFDWINKDPIYVCEGQADAIVIMSELNNEWNLSDIDNKIKISLLCAGIN